MRLPIKTYRPRELLTFPEDLMGKPGSDPGRVYGWFYLKQPRPREVKQPKVQGHPDHRIDGKVRI